MNLKQRRTRYRLTQQQLAEMLSVSQQTVARWESGAEIPSKYLKDLAIELGCRVSDLLPAAPGGDVTTSERRRAATPDVDLPFGMARFRFSSENKGAIESREYPIAESVRRYLIHQLEQTRERVTWITFDSLDNRRVLVNSAQLALFEMVDDDDEASPDSAHEEVYKALSDPAMIALIESRSGGSTADDSAPYSDKMVEECRAVFEDWNSDVDEDGIGGTQYRIDGISIETVDGRGTGFWQMTTIS